ncbi:MAG: hypothetical protein SV775_07015 [Thermodesulfobacteriota bacterium]|nr:hypothetical protein [Thermodesulfobacteriota bacterium]
MSLLNDALMKRNIGFERTKKRGPFSPDVKALRRGKKTTYAIVLLLFFAGASVLVGFWKEFKARQVIAADVNKERTTFRLPNPTYERPIEIASDYTNHISTGRSKDQKNEKKKSAQDDQVKPKAIENLKSRQNDKVKQVEGLEPEALFYKKAVNYHRRNMLKEAIQMYLETLRKDPRHFDALLNLASAYIESNAFAKACPLLLKLRSRDPERLEVLLNTAIAEIGLGRPKEGLYYLEKADKVKDKPQFEVYLHRGIALSHLEKLNDALKWYKMAEAVRPGHLLLLFNMAVVYDKLQRYDEALLYYITFLEQGISLPPPEKKMVETRIRAIKAYVASHSGQAALEDVETISAQGK